MENKYVVTESQNGIRLDKAISEIDGEISRMAVLRLLEQGKVTVNRKIRKSII